MVKTILKEQLASKRDLKDMEKSLILKLSEMENRLLLKFGGMFLGGIAIFAALAKLIK